MSRIIFGISTVFLGEDIKSLRRFLGNWSQERLAREVGCSGGAIRQWEKGSRRVNLTAVRAMASLARDPKLRKKFEAAALAESGNLVPKALPAGKNEREDEVLRLYSDAAEGLNLVWEAAMAGHRGAREVLADLADKLATRGGDWSRMKYLKKKR